MNAKRLALSFALLTAAVLLTLGIGWGIWSLVAGDENGPALESGTASHSEGPAASRQGRPSAIGHPDAPRPPADTASQPMPAPPEAALGGLSQAAVVGRVRTDDGRPLAGARVALTFPATEDRPHTHLSLARLFESRRGVASTDADGRFWLAADRWRERHTELAVAPPTGAGLSYGFAPVDPAFIARSIAEPNDVDQPFDVGDVTLSRTGSIAGRVLDAVGRAVAGAEVCLAGPEWLNGRGSSGPQLGYTWNDDGPRAVTDSTGAYRLNGVPRVVCIVMARAPDHRHGYAERVSIEPSGVATGVDVRLPPGVRVRVHVTDAEREPLLQGRVRLALGRHIPPANAESHVAFEAVVDEAGVAEFNGVPSRWFTIVADAPGHAPEFVESNAADKREAIVRVALRPSTVVILRPVDALTGAPLFQPGGREAAHLHFEPTADAQAREPLRKAQVQVAANGTLRTADAPAGTFRLSLATRLYGQWACELTLQSGKVHDLGDVPMLRGEVLRVHVVDAAGNPVPHVYVRVVGYVDEEDRRRPVGTRNQGRTDRRGRWTTDPVAGAIAEIRAIHRDFKDAVVEHELTGPLQPAEVQIVMRPEPTGVIRGVVVNRHGEPVPGRAVTLSVIHRHADRLRLETVATKRADHAGRYEFSKLTAGEYRVTHGEPARAGRDDVPSVRLQEGEHVERNVVNNVTFAARVQWQDGSPAAGVGVAIFTVAEGEDTVHSRGHAEPDGAFELVADYDARQRYFLRVEVRRGEAIDLPISPHMHGRSHPIVLPDLSPSRRGTIVVRLTDGQTGAAVSAPVRIRSRNLATGEHFDRRFDVRGTLRLANLGPGTYIVEGRGQGATVVRQTVRVAPGEEEDVTLTLR